MMMTMIMMGVTRGINLDVVVEVEVEEEEVVVEVEVEVEAMIEIEGEVVEVEVEREGKEMSGEKERKEDGKAGSVMMKLDYSSVYCRMLMEVALLFEALWNLLWILLMLPKM